MNKTRNLAKKKKNKFLVKPYLHISCLCYKKPNKCAKINGHGIYMYGMYVLLKKLLRINMQMFKLYSILFRD